MPPWASDVFNGIVGPFGAIFVLCLAIFFLWKLFREEQKENRANFHTVSIQSQAINDLTVEVRAWRAVYERVMRPGDKNDADR
jgi:hypothetical protein